MTTEITMHTSNSRSALVTGASYGLGRAICLTLAQRGLDIVATARGEQGLMDTAHQVRATGANCTIVPADLGLADDRARLIEEIQKQTGALTVFVHCASATPDPEAHAKLLATDDQTIATLVRTNVEGAIFLIRDVAKVLEKAARQTNIILISSDWALRGTHGPPAFSAAKAAITHLARAVRHELAHKRISISSLIPGDIATFDSDWAEPKWNLADPIEDVRKELGDTRISLRDMADTIDYILDRKLARIEEIILSPLDPDYDY